MSGPDPVYLMRKVRFLLLISCFSCFVVAAPVTTVDGLVAAVQDAGEGDTVEIAPGIYRLESPLAVGAGLTIRGAGRGKTVLTHVPGWKPSTEKLPDSEVNLKRLDADAYLVRLRDKAGSITISDLTLKAPQLHGALFGFGNTGVHLHELGIEDTLYCGIRTFAMKESRIIDCEFVDAGGKWKKGGTPGVDGGISGGAIFATWMADTEIAHNRFTRTKEGREYGHYGIKGRGGRHIHIHHNTIGVNFSIEFPFDGADRFEIDHNILHGVISIPKFAGGKVPESGSTFRIHHNYFTTSYAIEFVRNGVEISHNLFDFDLEKDGGNLISAFGREPEAGPAIFHNNLVNNPGRGVIWIREPYDNLTVRNNHVITRTTATPRKEGLFGLNGKSDFSTIRILDNLIECRGIGRPLLRSNASYEAQIRNNQLINVTDAARLRNPLTDDRAGLEEPLRFKCGVHGELTVDGWETYPTQ